MSAAVPAPVIEACVLAAGRGSRMGGAKHLLALEGVPLLERVVRALSRKSVARIRVPHPWFIESHRLGPFSGRGADVDVVLDLMIHDIDCILSQLKSKVKAFQAVGIPLLTHTSDIANARIEFETGCTASLTASRVSNEKIRKTWIVQRDGILSIDYLSQKLYLSKRGIPLKEGEIPGMVTEEIPVQKIDLLEAEIRSFLQSVRDRKRARVTGLDGKRALALALQIIQKIEESNKKKKKK